MKYLFSMLAGLFLFAGISLCQKPFRTYIPKETGRQSEKTDYATPFMHVSKIEKAELSQFLQQEPTEEKVQTTNDKYRKALLPVTNNPNLSLKNVQPYKGDKAKITIDVQIDWRGEGYVILFDSDHNTYGNVFPPSFWLCEGDIPADVMAEFEVTVPNQFSGQLDDSLCVCFGERISAEIEPGLYDYVVALPSDRDGICYIASGEDARGNDFVFQAGNEYIFTMTVDLPSDKCTLTADCQTDIEATDVAWPQTGIGLTANETVKARITNVGKQPIEAFTVSYAINGSTPIEESVEQTIEAGASYVHTFGTTADFSQEKAYEITITVNTENDGLNKNNKTTKTIYHVQSVPAPFLCHFDTESDMNKWLTINSNQDAYIWQWYPYNEYDPGFNGQTSDGGFATINCMAEKGSDDWLVTFQPVMLPAGESHIRFYYSGAFNMTAEHLQVYYGTTSEVNEMTLLQDYDNIQSSAWNFSAINLVLENADAYFFAFHAASDPMSAQIKIDEVEIREGRFIGTPDLSIDYIDLPYSSCGLTDAETVGVSITNRGTSDITKFNLSYRIDEGETLTETFTETIPMGLSKTVYFTDKFDFSSINKTYKISVEGTVIAQTGEKEEDTATLEDNTAKSGVTHFSPVDLPFCTDLRTAEGQSQWGCKYATWVYDESSQSLFNISPGPLVSRCMNLKAGKRYRITYHVMSVFENFDIVYGPAGTSPENWDTIASYRNFDKSDFQTAEVIEFTSENEGACSIAILPGSLNSWVYLMQTFCVTEVNEHDIRITDYTTPLGHLTPIQFAQKPSFEVQIENYGLSDESGVKVELRHGETLIATSDTISLACNTQRTIPVKGLVSLPAAGNTVDFTLTAVLPAGDDNTDDNTKTFTFETTDDEYAFDRVEEIPTNGCLAYAVYALGHVFTLTETDTLTAIKFGCTANDTDFPLGVVVYPIDEKTGKIGTAIQEKRIMIGKEAGFRNIEIPACLLSPGSYFIALRPYVPLSYGMSIAACDLDPNGYFYMTPHRDSALIQYRSPEGYIAVRAIFGHGASVIGRDAEVVSIDKPADKDIFAENETIEATLRNNGFETLTGVKVTCVVNGRSQEKTIDLAGYETTKIAFEANMLEPGYYDIQISAVITGDEVVENNIQSKTVRCIGVNPYAMDFEFCEDFAIENFTPAWTTVDADGGETYGFQDATFPHENDPYAFMAFNPSQTEPASPLSANNGKRFGACFASYAEKNNDWLISPKLTIPTKNPKLQFYVQSYVPDYGLEKYNVLISSTDNHIENFTQIGETREAPAYTWSEVNIDLQDFAGKKAYIAIQCVSENAFVFMIDDIEITGDMDTTGNEQASNLTDYITAYPNPASDRWIVTAYGLGIEQVEIFNTLGSLVYRSASNLSTEIYRLNVQNFKTGLYIARIHTKAGIQSLKLIVDRND